MPHFDIVKTNQIDDSFRNKSIIDRYELKQESNSFKVKGNLDLENVSWNIGVIVGASGTGKSTIAKEIFKGAYIKKQSYDNRSIIDQLGTPTTSLDDITSVLNSIGLGTAWSWLKPYDVLSDGEKMRCDLARAILDDKKLIVFDEFTSVVDRQIGKIVSFACQKTIRKQNKQFVAVTCHYDILEWLEPDWIYDTNKQEFFFVENNSSAQNLHSTFIRSQEITGDILRSITI